MFQRWPKCSAGKERECFSEGARSKYTKQVAKSWAWREATILLRHPLTTSMQQRSRSGIGLAIEETEFWVGRSVFARLSGTPARLVFSHHCTHNLATHLGRSCLAKPVLNCAANEVPAVTTGTPCQAMWQPWTDSLNPSSLGSSAQSSTNSIFPAPARD